MITAEQRAAWAAEHVPDMDPPTFGVPRTKPVTNPWCKGPHEGFAVLWADCPVASLLPELEAAEAREREWFMGTCDWGDCDNGAVAIRDGLPVCVLHTAAFEAAEQRADEATADNAALVKALTEITLDGELGTDSRLAEHFDYTSAPFMHETAREALASQPHPGAALLAERDELRAKLERSERVVEAVRPIVAYPVGSYAQAAFESFRTDVLKRIAEYDRGATS